MKSALNNVAQIIMALALVMLAMLSIACDKNMAPPEDLMNPGLSVTIGDFSASEVKIVTGDSTTLSWSVSDPKDIIQSISIDPGVSGALAMSGSKVVYPKWNTIYHLNIYSNNEIVKSQSIGITVTDDEGNEIPADADLSEPEIPTTEAVCDDKIDDDADGLTDCEDDDCASVALCQEPTYYFSDCEEAPHVVEGAVYAGEDLTITWKNCPFDEITVNGLAGYSFSAADGAYEFSAGEAGEVTVLLVGRVNGASKDTNTVKVDVSAVVKAEFSADVTFKITPSTVFAGQSYTVSWSVNNALEARMGDHAEFQGAEIIAVATNNTTYTLMVVDNAGIPETFEKTVKVRKFKSEGAFFSKPVTKIAKGVAAGEYYFVGEDNTIYKTTGNLSAVSEVSVGSVASDIVSLAVVDDTSILVGNKDGMFQVTDGTATQRVRTYGQETILAIHVRTSGRFVAGSEEGIYKVRPGRVDAFGAPFSGVISAYAFVTNPTDAKNVFAITSNGVYQSTDKGLSFVATGFSSQDVTDGFGGTGSFYIWSKSQVYQWNGENFSELPVVVNGDINFVYKKSGWVFVATTEGVFVKDGALWARVFSGNVKFLLNGSGIFKLTAITADGNKYGMFLTPGFSTTKGGR